MTPPYRALPLLALVLCSCFGYSESSTLPTLIHPSVCASEFERRARSVMAMRGLPQASTYFPEGEAAWQALQFPSSLCPDRALALAVETMLDADAPESFSSVHGVMGAEHCSAHCFLNRESTLWGMVADENSMLSHRVLPKPPGPASLRSNWIFFVSVSDLSEHGYWALVARDGSGVTWLSEN